MVSHAVELIAACTSGPSRVRGDGFLAAGREGVLPR
jgi:hypothetical protein